MRIKKIIRYFKSIFNKEFQIDIFKQQDKKNYLNIKKTENSKSYRIKLITSYDKNYCEIGDNTSGTIKKYAELYNYQFEVVKMPETGRPYAWNKIKILIDEIKKNKFDYLLWIDADAFFNNFSINISQEIDDKSEIYLVKHFTEVHKGSIYENTKLTILRINTGVMLIKVSDFNFNFLQKVWANEKYINHTWWEQAAITDLIGLRAELNGKLNDHKGNNLYIQKIKFLPQQWNSIPSFNDTSTEKHDPIIIHMAGMSFEERITYLKKYKF